jgi:uncharacterized protein
MRFIRRSATTLFLMLIGAHIQAASFDCARAENQIEKQICSNPQLSGLDDDLWTAYTKALKQSTATESLKREQRGWLADVRNRCASEGCLKEAYTSRLAQLIDLAAGTPGGEIKGPATRSAGYTTFCGSPHNQYETLACHATTEAALVNAIEGVLKEWSPYLERAQYPAPLELELASISRKYKESMKKCSSFECKQELTARMMENNAFPRLQYEALRKWISKEGEASPLIRSSSWRLNDSDARPIWKIESERIYRLGKSPLWLATPDPFHAPTGKAPFLDQPLTNAQVRNLDTMIFDIQRWTAFPQPFAGITSQTLNSVYVDDGGSAKCSSNFLYSSLTVDSDQYKIIEIKASPVDQQVPGCAFDTPYPDGFFGMLKDEVDNKFRASVVIDDVRGIFFRGDSTFWLKLSDDYWYRFRRDMTSDATEIGIKYVVLTAGQFENILNESKTVWQLQDNLIKWINARRPPR